MTIRGRALAWCLGVGASCSGPAAFDASHESCDVEAVELLFSSSELSRRDYRNLAEFCDWHMEHLAGCSDDSGGTPRGSVYRSEEFHQAFLSLKDERGYQRPSDMIADVAVMRVRSPASKTEARTDFAVVDPVRTLVGEAAVPFYPGAARVDEAVFGQARVEGRYRVVVALDLDRLIENFEAVASRVNRSLADSPTGEEVPDWVVRAARYVHYDRFVGEATEALEQWSQRISAESEVEVLGYDAASGMVDLMASESDVEILRNMDGVLLVGAPWESNVDCASEFWPGCAVPIHGDTRFNGLETGPWVDSVDGIERADLIQSQQYYDDGVLGCDVAAVLEGSSHDSMLPGAIAGGHPHFRHVEMCLGDEVSCVESDLWPVHPPFSRDDNLSHHTAVASVVAGRPPSSMFDADGAEQEANRRAGVAMDGVLLTGPGLEVGNVTRLSREMSRRGIAVSNHSYGNPSYPTFQAGLDNKTECPGDCGGWGLPDLAHDSLYRSGILPIVSAGNGNVSSVDWSGRCESNEHVNWTQVCTTGSPKAAAGTFVVGAHVLPDVELGSDGLQVNDPPFRLMDSSARGGKISISSNHGGERSILDLVAPSVNAFSASFHQSATRLDCFGGDVDVYCSTPSEACGVDWVCPGDDEEPSRGPHATSSEWQPVMGVTHTSGAAPVVTGAAMLFRQWYYRRVSSDIDDPGLLYANLLLMGDTTVSGAIGDLDPNSLEARATTGVAMEARTGFDRGWGSGKLQMRRYEPRGMGFPWGWGDGSVCVAQGEQVDVALAPGLSVASQDVERLRVVAYSFDHTLLRTSGPASNRDPSTPMRVDVGLAPAPGSSVDWIVRDGSGDNKKRVVLDRSRSVDGPMLDELLGGEPTLRFEGVRVPANAGRPEGCDVGKVKVHFAWFFEGSDREGVDDGIR